MAASIRISREIQCLPYAGFFLYIITYKYNLYEMLSGNTTQSYANSKQKC